MQLSPLEPALEDAFSGRNETELAPLTAYFQQLNGRQHAEYFACFVLAGVAAFLLMAPTAYHRVLFRRGDKRYLVTIANRLTIAGLGAVGMSMAGATMFVTDVLFGPLLGLIAGALSAGMGLLLWATLPLVRRHALSTTGPSSAGPACARSTIPALSG